MSRYDGIGRFKGFKFYLVKEQSVSGGSRLVEHNFPYRDEYSLDDMGAEINRYDVHMHFLGDDYERQFERFQTALKKSREGELVHPYFPRGRYIVESYRGGIEPEKQRLSYFSLTLIKQEKSVSPISGLNTLIGILESVNGTIDEMIDSFEKYWSVVDNVFDAVELVESMVDRVQYAVDSLMGGGRSFNLTNQLNSIKERSTTLVNSPRELASDLTKSILSIRDETAPSDAYVIYGGVRNRLEESTGFKTKWDTVIIGGKEVTIASAGSENFNVKSENNRIMLNLLVESICFCGQLVSLSNSLKEELETVKPKTVPKVPALGSYENPIETKDGDIDQLDMPIIKSPIVTKSDALDVLESTAEELDQLMLKLSDNGWDYISIFDTRLKFIQDLEAKSEQLIGTLKLSTKMTAPALVHLFQFKQDSQRWREFSKRNNIRNPLFVMANEEYEVLDD
ncbi:DNA circularization N-terminal domain-containing protein [Ignatzschineria rhizosphaerae]|uniref:DNA circularization N-terminal domain-containing protein n=1 Tax=Ignatzschineria rhizosphaerae TaxID=2923279 RepID=A0ABY3WYG6_9GAMM|nr:DNA circularization N-terminal domain-containing protein [Ignatzschineria rhizosphaerae]UNM95663.1 DNA circularization N-terminal domain-containing protein [Ignatzschineria rhizosphaerae]